ncbi:MAG: hypothetical protein RLY66_656 [Candidatus Parcubacteria bacterium]|jgi:hypothetical protein
MPTTSVRKKYFWGSYSLRIAFVAGIAVFVVLLGILLCVACFLTSRQADIALRGLDKGIAADKAYLSEQGDAVATDPHFVAVAAEGDPNNILSVLMTEREKRDIGTMGFVNKDGVAISRTLISSSTGQNTFVTSPQGRALAGGAMHIASVEIGNFDPTQIFMTTGRHVFKEEIRIGALFANRLMDDEYAAGFRDRYLPAGSQVLFYTKAHGIYGSSFSDTGLRQVISSYFNTDSDWIQSGKSGTMVRFDQNRYYQVRNVIFTGLEGNQFGGALILVPYEGYSIVGRIAFVVIAFLVFLYIAWRRRPSIRTRNRYYYWAVISFGFLMCVMMAIISRTSFVPYSQLRAVPYVLYNSTLRLQPEAGVFDTHFERQVSIILDTGNEHINAVSTVLSYDPKIIEIASVDTEDSICTQFLEKMIDTIHHQVRIACGLPSPGFSGSSGQVATIIFKPLKAGSSDIRFTNETMVLANDGLGTNVLRVATDGNYRFMDNIEVVQSGSNTTKSSVSNTPVVYSPSHPNGSRWYASQDVKFFWTSGAPTSDFIYSFDQVASTTLVGGTSVSGKSTSLRAPSDGIFYFHVAPIVGGAIGPVRDYKVMIDTIPPSEVVIKSSADQVKVGDVVRFEFEAEDDGSGLQNTMYIDIDNSGLFLPVGKQVYVPFPEPGSIPVNLRVYDKAGNYTQVEKEIDVNGKPGQWLMKLTH